MLYNICFIILATAEAFLWISLSSNKCFATPTFKAQNFKSSKINIDDTTVARANGKPANGVNVTSASFTPPNGALLLVMLTADTHDTVSPNNTFVVSDSTGLGWTNIVERDPGDGGASAGHASAWYAKVVTGTSMTVRVMRSAGGGSTNQISFKTYIITGHDSSNPIGASGEGSSTTNNLTATLYTSTTNKSVGFGCATDWNALGLPTSSDIESTAHYAAEISVVSAYKSAPNPTSGATVRMNFDASGSSAAVWNWVGVEIKPAP